MSDALLTIDNLHISFKTSRGTLDAIAGISLAVQRGEIFGIVGETGCGKTVTGLSVLGLLPKSAQVKQGSIRFEGRDLLQLRQDEMNDLRGRAISMIFQDPSTALNPVFTIGDQMVRVARQHLGLDVRAARRRAAEMLVAVGLPDPDWILSAYAHHLSGGMKQRAMIAMALLCQPSLIVADEPTTALDVTIQAQVLALLRELRRQFDVAVLLITHNLGVVAYTCDRLAVLYAGRVVESGSTDAVFSAPHHPYTRGLLAAIPRASSKGEALVAIAGTSRPIPARCKGAPLLRAAPMLLPAARPRRPHCSCWPTGATSAPVFSKKAGRGAHDDPDASRAGQPGAPDRSAQFAEVLSIARWLAHAPAPLRACCRRCELCRAARRCAGVGGRVGLRQDDAGTADPAPP